MEHASSTQEDKLAENVLVTFRSALAVERLREQQRQRGGSGRLKDTAAFLGDDGITVTMYANYNDDEHTVYSSFKLPKAIAEKDFDATFYRKLLE
jgi:hypothetical protein